MNISTKQSALLDLKKSPPKKRTCGTKPPINSVPLLPKLKGAIKMAPPVKLPKIANPGINPFEPKKEQKPVIMKKVAVHIDDKYSTNAGIKTIGIVLKGRGFTIINVLSSFGIITGLIGDNRIKELAALPGIKKVEVSPRY